MKLSAFRRLSEYRGWMGGLLIVPALVLWAFSVPRVLEGTWLDEVFDATGWLLLGCGMLLRLWATLYVGGRKSLEMVAEGPYAMCRHPLYVGSFLVVLALVSFLKSVTVLLAALLAIFLHAVVVIPSEEQHLIALFGQAYADYRRNTPRFVPRLRLLKRPGFVEVKAAAFLREAARDLGLMGVALASEFIAHARTELWWPHWLHLP